MVSVNSGDWVGTVVAVNPEGGVDLGVQGVNKLRFVKRGVVAGGGGGVA